MKLKNLLLAGAAATLLAATAGCSDLGMGIDVDAPAAYYPAGPVYYNPYYSYSGSAWPSYGFHYPVWTPRPSVRPPMRPAPSRPVVTPPVTTVPSRPGSNPSFVPQGRPVINLNGSDPGPVLPGGRTVVP